jgi:hypothetical protein
MTVILIVRSYREREPVIAVMPNKTRAQENLSVILQAAGVVVNTLPYHLALRDGHISIVEVDVPKEA